LKFSDPYDFFVHFLKPFAQRKKKQKNVYATLLLEPIFLNFGASHFFILGGPWKLWGPALFGSPHAETS
jgi:hypothetical protein